MNQESESVKTKKNPKLQLLDILAQVTLVIIFSIVGVGCGSIPPSQTATPTPTQAAPYPSGTLVLDDPLTHDNPAYGWAMYKRPSGRSCLFSSNAYHATESVLSPPQYHYHPCAETKKNFSNFTFEVGMTFTKDDDNDTNGGLIFRADSQTVRFYGFSINPQGNYKLFVSFGSDSGDQVLANGSALPFITGPNQYNRIGAVVKDNEISIYINSQHVTDVQHGQYTSGQVGVLVGGKSSVAEVVYTNAKVWQLPG